jgi:hypothetical protein
MSSELMQKTDRIIRSKYWFFNYYWLLICLVSVIGLLLFHRESIATIATIFGVLLSLAYFLQKQKLEETRLFREIFKECNARYDSLNDELQSIAQKDPESLNLVEQEKVIDYLNLCGEEYLYYKLGYIEPSVWEAWHNGMRSIVAAPSIRAIWDQEKGTGSYYELPL